MTPTPDEVDAVGTVDIDIDGASVQVSRWAGTTYAGRAIAPSRWYHVSGPDNLSYGLVDCGRGEIYAFQSFAVGQALGDAVGSLDEGIRTLVEG